MTYSVSNRMLNRTQLSSTNGNVSFDELWHFGQPVCWHFITRSMTESVLWSRDQDQGLKTLEHSSSYKSLCLSLNLNLSSKVLVSRLECQGLGLGIEFLERSWQQHWTEWRGMLYFFSLYHQWNCSLCWRAVRQKIGPFAQPDFIQEAPSLPKTRSGKIMRRILRKIAVGDHDLGDISTMADESVVDLLFSLRPHTT